MTYESKAPCKCNWKWVIKPSPLLKGWGVVVNYSCCVCGPLPGSMWPCRTVVLFLIYTQGDRDCSRFQPVRTGCLPRGPRPHHATGCEGLTCRCPGWKQPCHCSFPEACLPSTTSALGQERGEGEPSVALGSLSQGPGRFLEHQEQ